MSSAIRNAKQSVFQSKILRQSGCLASMSMSAPAMDGRLSKQRFLLNGAASVALLAVLGNLAIAQQTKSLAGNFVSKKPSCALVSG